MAIKGPDTAAIGMARYLSLQEGSENFLTLCHHCPTLIHQYQITPSATTQRPLYLAFHWPGISLPSGKLRKFLDPWPPLFCPHSSISDPSLYNHLMAAVSGTSLDTNLVDTWEDGGSSKKTVTMKKNIHQI